jgi:preprotein translocase subunit YajC
MLIFWLLPVMLLVMILLSASAGRKERRKREELLRSVKRNDKVQTAGGIIGIVAEMNDEEVVLRVEEGRIRVAKSSIAAVLREAKVGVSADGKAETKVA